MNEIDEKLRDLLQLVRATKPKEIDCEEFLSRVGEYVEKAGPDAALPSGLEAVKDHLAVCGECQEEYDALLRALRPDN